ncbi:MAG: sigma-70 family RNA polymerase sigma factor [Candidatus Competibacteraceae bacterium]
MVQEALTAAMRGRERFSGRAALKTWVFAILKNKIADHLRQRQHIVDIASLAGETDDDADFDILFDRRVLDAGGSSGSLGDPKRRLPSNSSGSYLKSVSPSCPNTARVFMMREFIGFDTPEICQELGITTSNCHVILHRARMGLRLCLEKRWFAPED